MPIDPTSPVPIYHQIADQIRRAVSAGVYRAEEGLPSVRVLALELAVNPNTVQRAYEELVREGLAYTRRGVGLFVSAQGESAARERSRQAVIEAFRKAIAAGQAANLSEEQISTLFAEALADANGRPRSSP